MKEIHIPAIILVILLLGFAAYLAYSASLLPDRVATHFGAGGQPNGWMSRSGYLLFIGVLGVCLPLIFVILVLFIRRIPDQFVNIPNKKYWLSPEHKEEYVSYVSGFMFWLACLWVLFFAGLHFLTIEANRAQPVQLDMGKFMIVLIGFMAAFMLWPIGMIIHFAKAG